MYTRTPAPSSASVGCGRGRKDRGGRARQPVCWRRAGPACCLLITLSGSYLVDPASSHMLVSKIKPCMSKYKYCTAKLQTAH